MFMNSVHCLSTYTE